MNGAPDEAVLDAVASEAAWMEDLLVRLVEAPTVLGAEEEGQEIDAGSVLRLRPAAPQRLAGRRSPALGGWRLAVRSGMSGASVTSSPTGPRGVG